MFDAISKFRAKVNISVTLNLDKTPNEHFVPNLVDGVKITR